jgi:hypothetical protein
VDRYQRIDAHGEMISSDLDGDEEPIRWLLGWQRQDRVVTSPDTEKNKDALIRTFGHRFDPWGSTLCRWDGGLVDQDTTRVGWTTSRACGSVLGLFVMCDRLLEPQEGQRFAHWMVIVP